MWSSAPPVPAAAPRFPTRDEMIGLFINTLPLRVRVEPDRRLDELVKEVRALQVGLREHEHTPLVKVQSWSDVPRGRPLFETILVYDDRTLDTTLRTLDPDGSRLSFAYHGQTNYPLTLIAYGEDEMLVRLENDRRRVDDAPASRMLDHLVTLLSGMPEHAEHKVHELPLLPEKERKALESAAVVPTFVSDRCLHERFEERARLAPERVAVVCDGESLTYGELDRAGERAGVEAAVARGRAGRPRWVADRAVARPGRRDPGDPQGGRSVPAARSGLSAGNESTSCSPIPAWASW